jgi:hypothetical protein
LVSGNHGAGFYITRGASGNVIQGNYIGTDVTGTVALGITGRAIQLYGSGNIIGGTAPGAGNLISGNGSDADPYDGAIFIEGLGDVGADNNVVQGNLIGTDVTGTVSLGRQSYGVVIQGVAHNNLVGGTASGARNVISGNDVSGVAIAGSATSGNTVQGNLIGTDVSGTLAVPNAVGVYIENGTSENLIGGTGPHAGNIISGNRYRGIWIRDGAAYNTVQGNFIGTDVTGMRALGNAISGVKISAAASNLIGGTPAGAGNLISGNGFVNDPVSTGLDIVGDGATGNVVQGNLIGTDVSGTRALGNTRRGLMLATNLPNFIGGTAPGSRNIISGNQGTGIYFVTYCADQVVQGNFIGTDITGTMALPNAYSGITVQGHDNLIGGTAAGAGNVISGNAIGGVLFEDDLEATHNTVTGNRVQGNFIGTDLTGTLNLGNGIWGVALQGHANILGGTQTGAGNLIAYNHVAGVTMSGVGDGGHLVQGNTIHDNTGPGVAVEVGHNSRIVGNSIYANTGLGIDLGWDGVTLNDPQDSDVGVNNLQNFPVLTAVNPGPSTRVAGTLNSLPNTTFQLDFYANRGADSSGYSEGQRYLGSFNVTTGPDGNASFDLSSLGASSASEWITATATDPDGNTSEFSLAKSTPPDVHVLSAATDGRTGLTLTYQLPRGGLTGPFDLTFYRSLDPSSHGDVLLRNYPKTLMKYYVDLVLRHSGQAGEGGDTRTGRTRTESSRDSSRPACRSAPESRGTCTARPASARRPTAAACDLSSARCSASPSGPARYAACTDSQPPPRAQWGCRSPHPGTGAAAPPGSAPAARSRWPRSSPATPNGHSRWPRSAPRPGGHRRRQPARFLCSPFSRDPWGFCPPFSPPKRALPSRPSAACHCQSTAPSSSHAAANSAQMRCMTPPADQRWNQSWTVLLGPNLRGNWSHWQPERIRKMMPLRAWRQLAWCRPVALAGQNSWRMGRTRSQRASGTSQIVASGWRVPAPFRFRLGCATVMMESSGATPPSF